MALRSTGGVEPVDQKILDFSFDGQSVRVFVGDDGVAWWSAVDVCACLGLLNVHRSIARLDEDERKLMGAHGLRSRDIWVLNEPGVYRLIFSSKKESAALFKRWVFHEVLPSIRKTGSYTVPVTPIHHVNLSLPSDPAELSAFLGEARQNVRDFMLLRSMVPTLLRGSAPKYSDASESVSGLGAVGRIGQLLASATELPAPDLDLSPIKYLVGRVAWDDQPHNTIRTISDQTQTYWFVSDIVRIFGLDEAIIFKCGVGYATCTKVITFYEDRKLTQHIVAGHRAVIGLAYSSASEPIKNSILERLHRKSIDQPHPDPQMRAHDLDGIFAVPG